MKVVFVMLKNYQEYIIDNIDNLIMFGNIDIVVICDNIFLKKFGAYTNITLIDVNNLYDQSDNTYNTLNNKLNGTYRNGFWELCLFRFNILALYMLKYNVNNIIHLENDVMVYVDLDEIFTNKILKPNKIYLTIDAVNRCIPGIMYIPNSNIIEKAISLFDSSKNDMENWYTIYKTTTFCETLPIMSTDLSSPIKMEITQNFQLFNCIFDAAAIGQYIGGIDPKNKNGDTRFFVNETCVFKYNNYQIIWKNNDNLKIPYMVVNDIVIRIVNLHIHCKNLKNFKGR
jgi:hypothetical protein